jgi:hypothetical protein
MNQVPHEGIIRIMALNQTAVPFRVMTKATPGTPAEVERDFSGFDMYQTVLLKFAATLSAEYESKSPAQMVDLMDKAHNMTEAYFQRVYKTMGIMNKVSKETAANTAPKKNEISSPLIVAK